MQVIGVRHHYHDDLFPRVMAYVSAINWNGKTAAIEEVSNEFRVSTNNFWREITEHIESHGGHVVLVDNLRLRKRQSLMHSHFTHGGNPLHQLLERKFNLTRTLQMVTKAEQANADFLITGVAHAYDIKKILGRKANVHIIAKSRQMNRYAFYANTLKRLRNQMPDVFSDIVRQLASVEKTGKKPAGGRLRPVARRHKLKPKR